MGISETDMLFAMGFFLPVHHHTRLEGTDLEHRECFFYQAPNSSIQTIS